MLADLTGRTALVTGGGQGVGKAIALALASQGADVALGDVRKDLLPCVVAEIEALGRKALGIEMDVRARASVESAVSRILGDWGHLDILVNNAGVAGGPGWIEARGTRDEDWDFVLAVNLRGVVNCCDAVLPHMMERRYGKIINISSTAGKPGETPQRGRTLRAVPQGSPYSVSKAAVIRLTQNLAPGAAQSNINVNCICPSRMLTQMGLDITKRSQVMNPALAEKDTIELRLENVRELNMFGRELTPADVGKMAAFLASEDARNITGQSINVDGGRCLT